MIFSKKTFGTEMATANLPMDAVANMYHKLCVARDYDWWYEVLPDDVVVDVGASVGMFSCKSLDLGAKKVYMIEPDTELLKTAVYNAAPYMMDTETPKVVPINYAIGRREQDRQSVSDSRMMSFLEFVAKYNIDHIDVLKISCDGAEYSILDENSCDFIRDNVRHVSVVCNLAATDDAPDRFISFRNNFLKRFMESNKVRYQGYNVSNFILDDEAIKNPENRPFGNSFMIYITNY